MANNRFNPYGFAYNQADRHRDGVLDRNEFRNYLNFQNADRNHDGRVGSAEFAHIAGVSIDTAQAFITADQNHDGRVDLLALRLFMNKNQIGSHPSHHHGHHHHNHNRRLYPSYRY